MNNKESQPKFNSAKAAGIVLKLLSSGKDTSLASQIEFVEYLNKDLMTTPMFIAITKSLKELQSIKNKNIPKKEE